MNRATLARAERLEGSAGGRESLCVVRAITSADGTEAEPEAYRDWRGNKWEREPGEGLEPFRERVAAGALALAAAGCAAGIIPCEREGL